jgi:DNA-binding response OmpR family regulator
LATAQPRVLVVEDEESLHALLQYNLEKEGFSVDVAVDGEEALMMIDERAPDIVILDWMLPKVSGIEVCRRPARQLADHHVAGARRGKRPRARPRHRR